MPLLFLYHYFQPTLSLVCLWSDAWRTLWAIICISHFASMHCLRALSCVGLCCRRGLYAGRMSFVHSDSIANGSGRADVWVTLLAFLCKPIWKKRNDMSCNMLFQLTCSQRINKQTNKQMEYIDCLNARNFLPQRICRRTLPYTYFRREHLLCE